MGRARALAGGAVSRGGRSGCRKRRALVVVLLIRLARRTRPQDVPEPSCLVDQLLTVRGQLLTLAHADASAIAAWISTGHLDENDPKPQAALRAIVEVPLEAGELCRAARASSAATIGVWPSACTTGWRGRYSAARGEPAQLALPCASQCIYAEDPSLVETMRSRLEAL